MIKVIVLTKRNLKIFLRDKPMVFFSFLSTLVLVMLYFLFIAKIYVAGMDNPEAGGIAMPLSQNAKYFIVYLQMMAGVLVLNSMSLATGAFSVIAKDFENKRIDNLLLTLAKTHEIMLSYFIAGLFASFVINTFTWVLSFIIIGISTGYWLGIGVFLMVLIVLFAASLVSCSIVSLITSLIKSVTAVGVFNGVSGTFFGFLCGIYMPYSNLGEGTKAVGSVLPFSHLTVWLKNVLLSDAFFQVGIEGEAKDILFRDYFTADSIGFCGLSAPLWIMILFSGLIGLLCLALAYCLLKKRIKGRGKEKLRKKAGYKN